MKNRTNTLRMTQLALLIAIEVVMALTPLGFLMIPPIAATLMHIPVIVGGILLGPGCGAILGGVFGLTALWKASTAATSPVDMAFSPFLSGKPLASLVMCLVPRILLGIIAALLFRAFLKLFKGREGLSIGAAAVLSTICHTVMVLGCLALFFREFGMGVMSVVLSLVTVSSAAEMLIAAVVAIALCVPLRAYLKRSSRS
ncbi:ECF transporter S component [Anaerofilum sp. BX8]|uniref:ECF transporter S component n=1 Tax=Anaerofilum hominis TaxID=2763016 RepID=A0A923L1S0_9FIRM|nr:ECF transporter S component [Anaerofilum hominis]MBC5582266.1 ECF transporter S component [Anaerofilum hominis]